MIKTGLVSITFRKLSPRDIVNLVSEAGLQGIEWGGDIHVPHGDIVKAKEVAKITKESGLDVAAYGSYYRVGCEGEKGPSFDEVLETALELKAPVIRVWAGDRGSLEADSAWWSRVVNESKRIADMAYKEGITVAYEYHGKTLTDTWESAYRLLTEVNHSNMLSYWQPPVGINKELRLKGLEKITPWLKNVHAFYWELHGRMPLEAGYEKWMEYMEIIKTVETVEYCMIEFVKGDNQEQFFKDAKILKKIVCQSL